MSDPRPFLYVIGAPGSGKSTILEIALRNARGTIERATKDNAIVTHTRYASGAIQLGYHDETRPHGGTDALPYNAQTRAIAFLSSTSAPAIIAEGDRLANDRFFQAIQDAGFDLTVAYIDVTPETAAARRRTRETTQDTTWTRGRDTKAQSLAMRWTPIDWWLDGEEPAPTIAERLREHPAVRITLGYNDTEASNERQLTDR